jgi:hypothetical protein
LNRLLDGFLRDLVKGHPQNGHFGIEHLQQMPGDGFPLAILVRGEVQGVCAEQQRL